MSQRGGDVQSNLRLSTERIYSDLIPQGQADLIISMEPMEALRYVDCLARDGWVVTSSKPFVNIPDYPDEEALQNELDSLPHVAKLDIDNLAKENRTPKSANMILLGMASPFLQIVSADNLRSAIRAVFAKRGGDVVEANIKAFNLGYNHTKQ